MSIGRNVTPLRLLLQIVAIILKKIIIILSIITKTPVINLTIFISIIINNKRKGVTSLQNHLISTSILQ